MPVNPAVEGRTYPPTAPYQISRAKIAEFAAAVGATDPLHTDLEAAQAAGYADVVAPPTFLVSVAQQGEAAAVGDPEAGIDFTRVVHGEQRFVLHRPAVAGEVVTAQSTLSKVRAVAGNGMVTLTTEVAGADGPLCTTTSVLVVRGSR